jgi:serine phosphatase RsbU (regulator of sigma subunit)/HAMP domain-containing protein
MLIRFGLKFKVAFIFVFLVIIMMATITYYFTIRELNLSRENEALRFEGLANNIATIRSVDTEDWDLYQTVIENQIKLDPDIVYIAIFNENGELKAQSLKTDWIEMEDRNEISPIEEANIVWRLVQRQIAEESQRDLESKSVSIVINGIHVGTVNVGFSLVGLNDEMRGNLNRNLRLGIIFIFLAIVISLLTTHRVVKPLEKLTSAMHSITRGDLDQSVDITAKDEIGEMARTFNFMTKGLKEKSVMESFGRDLGLMMELEKTARFITERIALALNARRASLFLQNKSMKESFEWICSYPSFFPKISALQGEPAMLETLASNQEPYSVQKLETYPEFMRQLVSVLMEDEKRLVCPIVFKKHVIGLFILDGNRNQQPYTDEEKIFLSTLMRQGSLAIENAILLEDLTERERFQREIEIAGMVQQGLLPQENPQIPELDIDGICQAAAEVGGDYYDFFELNDNMLGIAIADVTGKGSSAAFYMAVVKGMMISLTSIYTSPQKLLSELNKRLFGRVDRRIFITMTYAVIDLKRKRLAASRAGHNALIVRKHKDATVQCFTPDGIGLGLERGDLFDETIAEWETGLDKGDIFLFYTDGISEAMNAKNEEFGEKRILDVLKNLDGQDSKTVRKRIVGAVHEFIGDTPQHDDMTLVTLTVK